MAALPILFDTDIGTDVDDAIALGLTVASPELDLRAVTAVSGDTVVRARIAKELLRLGGGSSVPVAAGVREPVLRQRSFLWVGHEGQAILDPDAATEHELSTLHGVDLLIETVLRERLHVIAVGPLSNLAVAIMKEPRVIDSIPRLTIMGGALGLDPEMPRVEYNLASDPEAALVVLSSGIPASLVPADVTLKVAFTRADLERLRGSRSPLVHKLCDAIEIWTPIQQSFLGDMPFFSADVVAFLHDPLTVAAVIDPTLVTWEHLHLRPAIEAGEFRLVEDASAPALRVAVAVDVARFVEFALRRLETLA